MPTDWILVVPPLPDIEAELRFMAWSEAHGSVPESSPNVRIDLIRGKANVGLRRYWVRRDAFPDLHEVTDDDAASI